MFQKAPHNTANRNVLRLSGNTCDQAADTANDHLDLYAGFGCLDQFFDQIFVRQRVNLDANIRRLSHLCQRRLLVDHLRQLVLQTLRRNQQVLHVLHCLSQTEGVEHTACLQTDIMVGSHQRIVCVDGRRLFVIVARSHLCDIGDLTADLLGNQAELAVHLQIVQTINDPASGILQTARPLDVIFLVKACPQFHQHNDILAVFCGIDERLHDLAVGRHTIQSHLNGNDIRIMTSLIQQCQERADALIGECQEAVLLLHLLHHTLRRIPPSRFLRYPAVIEQAFVMAQHIPYHRQYREVQRCLGIEHLLLGKVEVTAERLNHLGVHQTGEFHLDRAELPPFPNQLLHCLTVVLFLLCALVRLNVSVPDDANERLALDGMAGEDLRRKVENQFLGQNEAVLSRGQRDDLRKYAAAARHDSQLFRALFLQDNHGIDIFVLQERKRLLLSDDLRREQRFNFRLEICLQPCSLFGGNGVEIYNVHALHAQFCPQVFVGVVLVPQQLPHTCVNCGQLLLTGHIGLVLPKVGIFAHLVVKRTAAHHEKFVQIALENRQKRKPLAKRILLILCLLQNTLVEFQPR